VNGESKRPDAAGCTLEINLKCIDWQTVIDAMTRTGAGCKQLLLLKNAA